MLLRLMGLMCLIESVQAKVFDAIAELHLDVRWVECLSIFHEVLKANWRNSAVMRT